MAEDSDNNHEGSDSGESYYEEYDPVDPAYENGGPEESSHDGQGLGYSVYEDSLQVLKHDHSGGHEHSEYRGLIEDQMHEDQNCNHKNSWQDGCLPFACSEELVSHGGSQTHDKHNSTHHVYAEMDYGSEDLLHMRHSNGCGSTNYGEPQVPERVGHLWDYQSSEDSSSDEQLEYEELDQDYDSLEHDNNDHEDLEGKG